MRFGVWTPLPHTVRIEPEMAAAIGDLTVPGRGGVRDASFAIAAGLVRRAEALGFDTTLIAQRYAGPDLDAWMAGAAMIAETSRIELMIAVHPGILPPAVAAKMGASFDRISGGRFAVNIVNGWYEEEIDLFGNGAWLDRSDARYRRMDEYIAVMRGLWTEDVFDFEGEFYTSRKGRLPIRPLRTPNPPIYAASGAPAGRETIARYGDTWFVAYEPGYANVEANLRKIATDIADIKARAAALGRTLSCGVNCHVICTESTSEAEERVAELEEYGKQDPVSAVAAKALGAGLVGTPTRIVERLRYYEEIGIDLPMVHFFPMGEGLETFAARIMPAFRGNAAAGGTA